jgi:GH15 family glucan-1,4-alpha-glucosidase
MRVPAGESRVLYYWSVVGRSLDDVVNLNAVVSTVTPEKLLEESAEHWRSWLTQGAIRGDASEDLPVEWRGVRERSLLVLQTQIDRCGAILAANDTDSPSSQTRGSYIWPRDGAFVARALDEAGCAAPAKRFFSFCAGIVHADRPFFLQRYYPDGSLGPACFPWLAEGEPEIPYQQDCTALMLWSLGKHFEKWNDKEFLQSIYSDLVAPAADFMVRELDSATNLPRPSYDLWEQRRGIHLFTCSAVYGALSAAAYLSRTFDLESFEFYRKARARLKKATLSQFFRPELDRFARTLNHKSDGWDIDSTIDISMAGVYLFNLLPADHPNVVSTMQAIYDRLWVSSPIGGLARYEDDRCLQVTADIGSVPGNPWPVSTLWMAQWYIDVASNTRDLEPASDLIRWTIRNASEAGLLPEQVHPFTGEPMGAMPLSWSHAALVSTLLKYEAKVKDLTMHSADKP